MSAPMNLCSNEKDHLLYVLITIVGMRFTIQGLNFKLIHYITTYSYCYRIGTHDIHANNQTHQVQQTKIKTMRESVGIMASSGLKYSD